MKQTLRVVSGLVALALLAAACSLGAEVPLPAAPPAVQDGSAPGLPAGSPAENIPAALTPAVGAGSPATLDPTVLPATELPTPTLLPSLTPTPTAVLRQLTQGGCCTQPVWAPDSSQVFFLDKPAPDAAAGIYGVNVNGGEPQLWIDRLGAFSNDWQYRAFPQRETTIVERMSDGQRWTIANGGRAVSFSPDSQWVAWTSGGGGPPFDTPPRKVWISRVDGSEAHSVADMTGGGFSGWFPDGQRMLISGRLAEPENGSAFWVLSLVDGSRREIARAYRLRGSSLSPDGAWLAYQVTFAPDPAENGLWLVNTGSGERFRSELFGSFRWRSPTQLLVVPLVQSAGAHQLWQIDLTTLQTAALTDPQVTPFKIAQGDWAAAPDGRYIVFLSAADNNLWLLSLP